MVRSNRSAGVWVLACVLAAAIPAHAQPVRETLQQQAKDRPWARGVSKQEQDVAFELYRAGNEDFAESRFSLRVN